MRLFVVFIVSSFIVGLFMWDSKPRKRIWVLLSIAVAVCIAYFYFDQL